MVQYAQKECNFASQKRTSVAMNLAFIVSSVPLERSGILHHLKWKKRTLIIFSRAEGFTPEVIQKLVRVR